MVTGLPIHSKGVTKVRWYSRNAIHLPSGDGTARSPWGNRYSVVRSVPSVRMRRRVRVSDRNSV